MTHRLENSDVAYGPEGSIFLPEITSVDDVRRHRFALLMNRSMPHSDYRDMDPAHKEQVMHWLQEEQDRLLGARALKA